MKFLNHGFDHIEFSVNRVEDHMQTWKRMGFEVAADQVDATKGCRQVVMQQGQVRLLLVQYDGSPNAHLQAGYTFLKAHNDGICVLGMEVEDAAEAFRETVARGARPAIEPRTFESPEGRVTIAEIYSPADFRYRFVTRHLTGVAMNAAPTAEDLKRPALFLDNLVLPRLESPSPTGIYRIDHLTNNIDMGQFNIWLNFYKDVFQFKAVRRFNIKTGRTGLLSDVVQSECGRIKVPINEATEPESQVQEFVDRFKGAGVQHLAFSSTDIIGGLKTYRANGIKFLNVPDTYYDVVPTRVPGVTEDLELLKNLRILLDGEGGGYLMQIFSEELVGPFFCEIIQRKGNDGFGEGNFQALFEAIERDQIKRGSLKA